MTEADKPPTVLTVVRGTVHRIAQVIGITWHALFCRPAQASPCSESESSRWLLSSTWVLAEFALQGATMHIQGTRGGRYIPPVFGHHAVNVFPLHPVNGQWRG